MFYPTLWKPENQNKKNEDFSLVLVRMKGGENAKGLVDLWYELPEDAAAVRLSEANKKTLHFYEGFLSADEGSRTPTPRGTRS